MASDEPDPILIPSRANEHTSEYAARMVYLVADQRHPYNGPIPDPRSRSLKPPILFLSRRQARINAALCGSTQFSSHSTTTEAGASTATHTEVKAEAAAARRAKRHGGGPSRRSKRSTQDVREGDAWNWSLQEQAGVRFWVNRVTGEATDECPYPDMLHVGAHGDGHNANLSSKERLSMFMSTGNEIATGASVYDRTHYEEAMWVLDGKRSQQQGA